MIDLTNSDLELINSVIYFEDYGDSMSPADYNYYYLRNEVAQVKWGRYLTDLIEAVKAGDYDEV